MTSERIRSPRTIYWGAALFCLFVFLVSWWHWWTFQYGTFDLAFYVQALWLALRGQWMVSLLSVPLMGNHAEPLVFLLLPLFALCPHPMLLVAVQTAALASMAFTGYRISTRLGYSPRAATALGLALLLMPAVSSVGIYEFHPEALAAPLLLLLVEARLAGRYSSYALWFLAVLACKENMALVLGAMCGVFALLERRKSMDWQWRWNLGPLALTLFWLAICVKVISPILNAGNVDYGQLYAHLGGSGGEIVKNFFVRPEKAGGALWNALRQGNMVWALLAPLLFLPLLRPRWLLIAAPLLLQHLLSWRYTEWSLGAHYPAPFIPLFWVAAVEAASKLRQREAAALAVAAACLLANLRFGPGPELVSELPGLEARLEAREWKARMLAAIPPQASVMAVQPFLSHLAKRERVYSLHHVLKGLKTLSKEPYVPPPAPDVVAIDYNDTTTFSPMAGFYHPRSRVDAERYVPSSDRLLHEFLSAQTWRVEAQNELTVLTRGASAPPFRLDTPPVPFDAQTTLLNMQIPQEGPGAMRFRFAWEFGADREVFPWLMLVLSDGKHLYTLSRGACAPEAGPGRYYEQWLVVFPTWLPAGHYDLFALFYDASQAVYNKKLPPGDGTYVLKQIPLGSRELKPGSPESGAKNPP